jgi:hypothetical protein
MVHARDTTVVELELVRIAPAPDIISAAPTDARIRPVDELKVVEPDNSRHGKHDLGDSQALANTAPRAERKRIERGVGQRDLFGAGGPALRREAVRAREVCRVVVDAVDAGANVSTSGEVVAVDSDAVGAGLSEKRAANGRRYAHALVDAHAQVVARTERLRLLLLCNSL